MDYFHSVREIKPEKGDLLISEPYLPDPNFERTVILLCSHDENGSFGYVLNHESKVVLSDLVPDVNNFEQKVFVGGPVQQDTLHFIHRSSDNNILGEQVTNGVFWGGDYERLLEIIKLEQVSESDFKFLVGYSGWSAGQLQEELDAKSWFVYKHTTPEKIFDIPSSQLWKSVLEELGGKFKMISNYPTDPRMN